MKEKQKIKGRKKWIRDADIILTRYEKIGNSSQTARNFENYFTAQQKK